MRGESTPKVLQRGHNRLPTFGVGADVEKTLWRSYLRQLVAADVLKIDIGGYGALQQGRRSQAVLRGEESVALHSEASSRQRRRDRTSEAPEDVDKVLFGALKQLRLEIAKEEGVPAYVVFNDRSLTDMASRKPQNLDALAGCHGVGAVKLERYGEQFLAVLNGTGPDMRTSSS